MARNLLCDHRISEDRWRHFLSSRQFASAGDLTASVSDYYLREIVPAKLDPSHQPGVRAFERPENQINEVRLPPGAKLGTVVNLTRLGRVLQAGRRPFRIPQFERIEVENALNPDALNRVFLDYLSDDSRRTAFLKALLKAARLYNRRLELSLRCTWAADWNTLSGFLVKNNPQRWLQAVGVATETPAWLAVFKYSVADLVKRGIRLFRPTQLDAGWNAHHFPSPPPAPLPVGGHTMFLGLGHGDPSGFGLVNEYLHAYLDFDIKHWEAAGSLVAPVLTAQGDLLKQRASHKDLLQQHYGAEIGSWLAE